MADPATSASVYYTNAQYDSVYYDDGGTSLIPGTDDTRLRRTAGLRHQAHYVEDLSATAADNDWTQPRGVFACAWQPNTSADGIRLVKGSQTSIRALNTGAGGQDGWYHILYGGAEIFTADNDTAATPESRGTTGYVQPGSIYIDKRVGTDNLITDARPTSIAGLRLRIIPFAGVGDADTYTATSTGKLPGLVAVAWQTGSADATSIAVTLDASGDVLWTIGAGTVSGWLWAWTRG